MPVRGGPVLGIGVIEAILGVDNSRLDNRSAEKAENKHEALVGRSEVRSTRVLDPARVPGGLGSCELRSDQALLVPSRPEIPSSTATIVLHPHFRDTGLDEEAMCKVLFPAVVSHLQTMAANNTAHLRAISCLDVGVSYPLYSPL